jgi:tetrahydromethanopterin S-methyltransferase subunit B
VQRFQEEYKSIFPISPAFHHHFSHTYDMYKIVVYLVIVTVKSEQKSKVRRLSHIAMDIIFLVWLLVFGLFPSGPLTAATFIVTNTDDSDFGSLRQAILDANANPGLDTIIFSIGSGVATITPTSALPTITDPVNIDGTTQPGFTGTPIIELNGTNAGAGVSGLFITSGNSTVRGLVINRFSNAGIRLDINGGNVIEGNFIGTDITGTKALGNSDSGVAIIGSFANTIGGSTPEMRNVISANGRDGIWMSSGAMRNLVLGNFIGTDVTGSNALGNSRAGVFIESAPNNIIGGTTSAARNIISGNEEGIAIANTDSTGNLVQGNLIGTDVTGTKALGNRSQGVHIENAPNNVIGGMNAGARNIISGNLQGVSIELSGATENIVIGNFIGTDITGTKALGNSDSGVILKVGSENTIGGTTLETRNVISANGRDGVQIGSGAMRNMVQGNLIGTDVTGTSKLGNSGSGVSLNLVSNNIIGGTTSEARNVISGNGLDGISFNFGVTDTQVQGNFIGTDVTGTKALGNTRFGVFITHASGNMIGGTADGTRNIISGNGGAFEGGGIGISEGDSTGNLVRGNLIGTDVTGSNALGNSRAGVFIEDAANNTIGGTMAGARNVISGNNGNGVWINRCSGNVFQCNSTGNLVQGNFIGTDVTGTRALGNSGSGVYMELDASNNRIGGITTGAGNVISGNGGDGIWIAGGALGAVGGGTGNVVQGNFIGTQVNGTSPLGNASHGVHIASFATNNAIGGTIISAGNTIAFNGGDEVLVESGTGNAIQHNAIFSNTRLGIDLSANGVISNDLGDSDTGANNLQNFPVLTSVVTSNGSMTIRGTLNSTPNTTFILEFFSSTACNPSGFGEGQKFLGSMTVTTEGSGNADISFRVNSSALIPTGQFITATATDPSGNTSEFSRCLQITNVVTSAVLSATMTDSSTQ